MRRTGRSGGQGAIFTRTAGGPPPRRAPAGGRASPGRRQFGVSRGTHAALQHDGLPHPPAVARRPARRSPPRPAPGRLSRLALLAYCEVRRWARQAGETDIAEHAAAMITETPYASRQSFLDQVDGLIAELDDVRSRIARECVDTIGPASTAAAGIGAPTAGRRAARRRRSNNDGLPPDSAMTALCLAPGRPRPRRQADQPAFAAAHRPRQGARPLRGRQRPHADGRQRPPERLRRGDEGAGARQGPAADADGAVLVRRTARHRAQPPDRRSAGERGRGRRGGAGGGPFDAGAAPHAAALRGRGARLRGRLGLEGVCPARHRVRHRPAAGAGA